MLDQCVGVTLPLVTCLTTCITYVSQQGLELQYEPRIVLIGQQLIKSERHGLAARMRRRWLLFSIVILILL